MLGVWCARIVRPLRSQLRAALSTKRFETHHGGYLDVLLSNAKNAKIDVVTTWEEHVEIETQDEAHLEIWRDHEGIHVVDKLSAKEVAFTARIPQRFNCLIRAPDSLDLNIQKKLEGDMTVSCQNGTINLEKIRGMIVNAICTNGTINVTHSVEGEISFTATNVYAKLLNGSVIHVDAVERAEVVACYSASAAIVSRTAGVKVSTAHGSLLVEAKGTADVQGVSGSFNVVSDGDVKVDVRKLAVGSHSRALSREGSVLLTLDPSVTPDKAKIECYDLTGRPVAVNLENLPTAGAGEAESGSMTNTASRRASGKIALAEADAQSLDQFVKSSYYTMNNHGYMGDLPAEEPRPPIVELRAENIQCRYLSWKDAIKSKYGLL